MMLVARYLILIASAAFAGVLGALTLSPTATAPVAESPLYEATATTTEPFAALISPQSATTSEIVPEKSETAGFSPELATPTSLETEADILAASQLSAVASIGGPTYPTDDVFASINDETRKALVNIICSYRDGRYIKSTTGSGIIIDPHGVILTNAHVADLFLLKGSSKAGRPTCSIRAGNPAREAYEAEVLYFPEGWVNDFAPKASTVSPTGSGEKDFALLLITKPREKDATLPETFPFISPTDRNYVVTSKERVLVAGYPAIAQNIDAIRRDLFLVSALADVQELYTFTKESLDLFSLEGNIAAEQGSSGGAVVNSSGELVGIVVTSTRATSSLDRKLRTISTTYISREIEKDTDRTLSELLSEDAKELLATFQTEDRDPLAQKLLKLYKN